MPPAHAGLTLAQAIMQAARRYNLDPYAMMAIASHESGMRWGAVGDSGSSFGPFQLHKGGALPRAHYGDANAWANSLAGVMYAARQMAASGAAGLRGRAAIEAISRRFERPANPGAEIADAVSWYRQNRGRMPTGGAAPAGGGGGRPTVRPRSAGAMPQLAPIQLAAPSYQGTDVRSYLQRLFPQTPSAGPQPLGAPLPPTTPTGYTSADLSQQLSDLRRRLLA